MFDEINYNSPCSFAEEIVEYIYDEMNGESKAEFETHLAKCNSCADELTGFGIVRSQVSDWKLKEFSSLTNPRVELPIVQTVENTRVTRRWFENLRDLVMLSPAFGSSAAFAILAICLGIGYFTVGSNKQIDNDLVASKTPVVNQTPPVKLSPTLNIEPLKTQVESADSKPKIVPPKPIVEVVKATSSTPKKIIVQAVQTESKPVVVPKNKPNRGAKPVATPKRNEVNLILNNDDDDESLRLSDLFDEVSMK
jgi:hypothetical protein